MQFSDRMTLIAYADVKWGQHDENLTDDIELKYRTSCYSCNLASITLLFHNATQSARKETCTHA